MLYQNLRCCPIISILLLYCQVQRFSDKRQYWCSWYFLKYNVYKYSRIHLPIFTEIADNPTNQPQMAARTKDCRGPDQPIRARESQLTSVKFIKYSCSYRILLTRFSCSCITNESRLLVVLCSRVIPCGKETVRKTVHHIPSVLSIGNSKIVGSTLHWYFFLSVCPAVERRPRQNFSELPVKKKLH